MLNSIRKGKGPVCRVRGALPSFSPTSDMNMKVGSDSCGSVDSSGQSQGRLVLHVAGSGGGRSLALLVEFQEAGFLDDDGHRPVVAAGVFHRGERPFLLSFGRVPLPVDRRDIHDSWEFSFHQKCLQLV